MHFPDSEITFEGSVHYRQKSGPSEQEEHSELQSMHEAVLNSL